MAGTVDPGSLPRVISKIRNHALGEGGGRNVFLRSRSDHHRKVTKRKETLKVSPCLNLLKSVPAQNEEKNIFVSLSKGSEGVDGERSPRP